MGRQLFTILLLLGIGVTAYAKKEKLPDLNLVEWSEECAKTQPAVINGIELSRFNLIGNDGVASVTGSIPLEGIEPRDAMAAFLLKVHDYMENDDDNIYGINLSQNSFSVTRTHFEGEGKDLVKYTYTTAFYFNDGFVSFVSRDVSVEYKEKGILARKLPIEKFKPHENERHRDIVETFIYNNSLMVDGLKSFANENPKHDVTHWSEISLGKVEKGMNKTEVAIIGGMPASTSKTAGNREQWVYDHTFIVMFLDDEVVGYVQK